MKKVFFIATALFFMLSAKAQTASPTIIEKILTHKVDLSDEHNKNLSKELVAAVGSDFTITLSGSMDTNYITINYVKVEKDNNGPSIGGGVTRLVPVSYTGTWDKQGRQTGKFASLSGTMENFQNNILLRIFYLSEFKKIENETTQKFTSLLMVLALENFAQNKSLTMYHFTKEGISFTEIKM
ncbi:MAG: hypothetical protein JWM20_109 [Patescibacteria group bacterium]|nr:hypothetical protein [Patescibacteria group bacterium]